MSLWKKTLAGLAVTAGLAVPAAATVTAVAAPAAAVASGPQSPATHFYV